MVKGKPISPHDVHLLQQEQIPDRMFDVVNELIAENLGEYSAIIRQRDILERFGGKDENLRAKAIRCGWLNFEDLYRKAGWSVRYEKPAYNETGEAVFIFTRKS